MAIKITETEREALRAKERDPKKTVICPRCGEELYYREVGNSYEVKCPTIDCIGFTVRGI